MINIAAKQLLSSRRNTHRFALSGGNIQFTVIHAANPITNGMVVRIKTFNCISNVTLIKIAFARNLRQNLQTSISRKVVASPEIVVLNKSIYEIPTHQKSLSYEVFPS